MVHVIRSRFSDGGFHVQVSNIWISAIAIRILALALAIALALIIFFVLTIFLILF